MRLGYKSGILLASISSVMAGFLIDCGGSSADIPDGQPDASLFDAPIGDPDGGGHQQCTDCTNDQVCSDGKCVNLPATCPCPKGSYCKVDLNQCVRGCTQDDNCSNGEYCDTGPRTCKVGCRGNTSCALPETCGGSGVPNQCGCAARACNGTCGTIDNGCGKQVNCGACCTEKVCNFAWTTRTAPANIESLTDDNNGNIYALISVRGTYDYSIQQYKISTKTWAATSVTATTRDMPQIAWLNNRVFISGGFDEQSRDKAPRITTHDLGDAGVTAGNMRVGRAHHNMIAATNVLIIAGDTNVTTSATTAVEIFRVGSSATDGLGSLPRAVSYPGLAVTPDNMVYITGGVATTDKVPTQDVFKVSTSGSGITRAGTLRHARGRNAAVAGPGNRVYIFGGDATKRHVEVFPGGGELPPLPAGGGNVIAAVLGSDGHFYVVTDAPKMFTTAP